MMKNKAYDIVNYTFAEGEVLLLDANIWLYLFPVPFGSQKSFIKNYSAAFKKMKAAKITLVTDVLILSEYLNRYCRIEFDALHKQNYPSFKAFRQSDDYQSVGQTAIDYAKQILKHCEQRDHNFSIANMTQILSDVESGIIDFNDGMIADTCFQHNWKLVTNDGDFIYGGIDVLTCHRNLLNTCPAN